MVRTSPPERRRVPAAPSVEPSPGRRAVLSRWPAEPGEIRGAVFCRVGASPAVSAPRASAPRRERGSARSRSTEAAAVPVRAGCSGQGRPQQRASGSIVMAGRAYPRPGGTGGITVRCWCAVGETARLPRERQLARVESGRRGWHVL
jgi:hypothetical protein